MNTTTSYTNLGSIFLSVKLGTGKCRPLCWSSRNTKARHKLRFSSIMFVEAIFATFPSMHIYLAHAALLNGAVQNHTLFTLSNAFAMCRTF